MSSGHGMGWLLLCIALLTFLASVIRIGFGLTAEFAIHGAGSFIGCSSHICLNHLLNCFIISGMTFDSHVSEICNKASQKLHALSRVQIHWSHAAQNFNASFYTLTIRLLPISLDVS